VEKIELPSQVQAGVDHGKLAFPVVQMVESGDPANGSVKTLLVEYTVGDQAFTFSDVGEVRRSLARLGENNLHERPHPFSGVFQGALPKRRTFEFRVAATAEVITGKIGPGVPDPAALNHHLEQPTDIQLIETRVGEGRPRYVLNQLPNWT